jgi:hypothetical protein
MIRSRIEGSADIMAALRELPKAVGRAALTRVGVARLQPMCDAAADNAPEDEGDLKGSMAVSTRQGNAKARRARVQSKATVEVFMGPTEKGYPQAIPQEMGSRNNPPKGYMRKAWDEHHEAVLEGIGEDLSAEITKTAERRARRARGGA